MTRKFLIPLFLAVAAAGFLSGWLVYSALSPASVNTANVDTEPLAVEPTAEQLTGWCCPAEGSLCTQASDAKVCITGGGRVFVRAQDSCQKICTSLSAR
jgi:hypothetical protein